MVQTKLLLVHPNTPDLETLRLACQEDVCFVEYVPKRDQLPEGQEDTSTDLKALCADKTHVGLVWNNAWLKQEVPFTDFEEALHDNLTVDLITCSLGKGEFPEQMKALESKHANLQIRYSLDNTANPEHGGDWIMESHQVSVKAVYFTDALDAYAHRLDDNNIFNLSKTVVETKNDNTVVTHTWDGTAWDTDEDAAFDASSTYAITIRDDVTSIESDAFFQCHELTSVTMPEVTSIGEGAFGYCSGLTSVHMPMVTSIGGGSMGAFETCDSLTTVLMPNVKNIESWAFYGCDTGGDTLTSVTMPEVESIGQNAFLYCTLKAVGIDQVANNVGANAVISTDTVGIDSGTKVYKLLPVPTVADSQITLDNPSVDYRLGNNMTPQSSADFLDGYTTGVQVFTTDGTELTGTIDGTTYTLPSVSTDTEVSIRQTWTKSNEPNLVYYSNPLEHTIAETEPEPYQFVDKVELQTAVALWISNESTALTTYGQINTWDVSNVTNMNSMFSNTPFNQDISNWDVSSVTDMGHMFSGNTSFNQDLSDWDVSNVTNMNSMFSNTLFNQDISSWDVNSVTDMNSMFSNTLFNQDISNWDVSSVTDMGHMFSGNTSFNQDLSYWDVSNVTNMNSMFSNTLFNQDISSWDVSSVTNMNSMFLNTSFNQNISSWDVSSVTDMNSMFDAATSLSDVNKCAIHATFSTNIYWSHEWSGSCPPATSGDPHIFPLRGNAYELPNRCCAYRMVQGKNLVVNANTRAVTQTEEQEIQAYYKQVTGEEAPESLVTNGVFYENVFIQSEGHVLEYSFDKKAGSHDAYFQVEQKEGKSTRTGEICPKRNYASVTFTHSVHGKTTIELNHFANPQLKHGMSCQFARTTGLSGLLIEESKCKTMRCGLKSTKKVLGRGSNKLKSVLELK